MMEVLETATARDGAARVLYENDFPDWFVKHAEQSYTFDWECILRDVRSTSFFFPGYCDSRSNITGGYLNGSDARNLGEALIRRLAALATTLQGSASLVNSLQLEGLQANSRTLELLQLEGPVSAQVEEDGLRALVRRAGLPNSATIFAHATDAHDLFEDRRYHPSLNESRNLLQSLVDDISTETDSRGGHATALPGGTANRIRYLGDVGFLTPDEQDAFRSAWWALSAGSHPGVPEQDEARIGLILALEFGQLLLLKYENWRNHGHRTFV